MLRVAPRNAALEPEGCSPCASHEGGRGPEAETNAGKSFSPGNLCLTGSAPPLNFYQ
jgi:hypothetical protein